MSKNLKGICVSVWNGLVDFVKAKKAGFSFALIRIGYGVTGVDEAYKTNIKSAKKAGVKVGVYWQSYATTAAMALVEANTFLQVLNGANFDMPVYVAMENNELFNVFYDVLLAAGYEAGNYMRTQNKQEIADVGVFDVIEYKCVKKPAEPTEDATE